MGGWEEMGICAQDEYAISKSQHKAQLDSTSVRQD